MRNSFVSILERSSVVVSGATGPTKSTIVFLQGLSGYHTDWRPVVSAFEGRYQVVVLDLGGANKPDHTAAHATLQGLASDLLNVLSALALHDVVFVGHSVGAMVGMLAAVREPERFSKMVHISPAPRFLNEADYASGFEQQDINELLAAVDGDHSGWSDGFPPVSVAAQAHPELVMEFSNSFVQSNPEIVKHFARVTFFSETRAELNYLTIPTLIVQSAHDVVAPLAVGHLINERLANSRIAVVETGGHCPHLSAPHDTLAAMDHFMHHETACG